MDWKKIDKKAWLAAGTVAVVLILIAILFGLNYHRQSNNPANNSVTNPGNQVAPKANQITQNQKAGEKSGYKIDISLDTVPINPYPGSITKGHVRILNAQGKLATEVNGGVRLFAGETLGSSNTRIGQPLLAGSSIINSASEYGMGLSGLVAGNWKLREDGSNIYDLQQITEETIQENIDNKLVSVWPVCFKSGSGWMADTGARLEDYKKWAASDDFASPETLYLLLTNGQADFSYINRGLENPLLLTAIANEEPIYPVADPKYKFRWGHQSISLLIGNGPSIQALDNGVRFSAPPAQELISDEPASVRAARLAQLKGYQVVGTPVHYRSADIVTTATVPFGEFNKFPEPKTPNQQLIYAGSTYRTDILDYYYDVTFSPKQLTSQTGAKFTMTIRPKALPGKTLPTTIHDNIELYIDEGYTLSTPTIRTSRQDGWLKRNYLAYFSGYNGKPLSGMAWDPRIGFDPSNDAPQSGWVPKGMGGSAELVLNSGGDTMTLEMTQTGERSVLDFISFRLKTQKKTTVSGKYDRCTLGTDQIISIPVK